MPYRSVLVASSNDPYCPVRTAGAYARAWGREFVRLQNAGHINVEAGFGAWPLGLALLQSLMGGRTCGICKQLKVRWKTDVNLAKSINGLRGPPFFLPAPMPQNHRTFYEF